jgi:hypothetical protein
MDVNCGDVGSIFNLTTKDTKGHEEKPSKLPLSVRMSSRVQDGGVKQIIERGFESSHRFGGLRGPLS